MSHRIIQFARLFKPGLPWMLALLFACIPALFYVFLNNLKESAVAYVVYVCSAYTLTVWVIWCVGAVKRIRSAVYAHPFGRRYLTDLPFRGRLSLCSTTAINFCYAVFELGAALFSRSFWFGALGVYYLLLTAARGVLLYSVYGKDSDLRQELQAARLCSWLLLALNLALSAVTAQMVADGKGYAYPGTMIFVMAFYAFYSVALSIVNLVRFRKLQSPVLSASKVLGVATALVSMLSLQTAMFASFGGAYAYQRLMNILTSAAVCLLLSLMAVLQLVKVNRALHTTVQT